MPVRALDCPKCGGPLPPEARRRVVVCRHCGASVFFEREIVEASRFRRAFEQAAREQPPLVRIGESVYNVVGRIAQGQASDVLLGRRAQLLSESVTLKLARTADGALDAEHAALSALAASRAPMWQAYGRLVPEIVKFGEASAGDYTGRALATRYASGFVHTLADVRSAYPAGLDARHGVWIWRRLLELLGWVHASGWAHGAVAAEHVLVHARDHGARLVGWSHATPHDGAGQRLAGDVTMATRAVQALLGAGVPSAFETLLARHANASTASSDAFLLAREVGEMARELYGAPKFVKLELPGWS